MEENNFDIASLDSYYEQVDITNKQSKRILLSNFKKVLGMIDYPSLNIKEYLRDMYNYHYGYCKMVKDETYKSWEYPSYTFYNVLDEDNDELKLPHHFMRQDDNSEDNFHCLVWQTTGCCEDDYSGYIMFPLTDGTYWVVKYHC